MFRVPVNSDDSAELSTRTLLKNSRIVLYAGYGANGYGLWVNQKPVARLALSESADGESTTVSVSKPKGMNIYKVLEQILSIDCVKIFCFFRKKTIEKYGNLPFTILS